MAPKRMHTRDGRATKRSRPATRTYHPGPPIADEASLAEAAERLRAKDPELVERMVAIGGRPPLRRREPGFAGLAAIIVSQQVSTASASAIFGRLAARIVPLEAARLAGATEESLRACGLSTANIRALQEAAKLALNLKRRPDAARLERIAERWRPLRGVAARMLWAYYRGVKARSGMALADGSG
jgi:DNA-3-methyladenine glycosylase II